MISSKMHLYTDYTICTTQLYVIVLLKLVIFIKKFHMFGQISYGDVMLVSFLCRQLDCKEQYWTTFPQTLAICCSAAVTYCQDGN